MRVEGGVLGVTEKGSDTERKRESEREGVRERERERCGTLVHYVFL